MSDDHEQRIRERAYALWEQEGRPQGEDLRHWIAALAEISREGSNQTALTENLSVLGDQEGSQDTQGSTGKKPKTGSRSAAEKKRPKTSKTTSAQLPTGQESARAGVRRAEGP